MCEGYEKAIFSGITNTELGKIIAQHVVNAGGCWLI